MNRTLLVLAGLLLATPLAAAHPPATGANAGTLVADAFSGCTPTNCDVLYLKIDPLLPHTFTHQVSTVHSSGNPVAYNFYVEYYDASAAAWVLVPGCFLFTPGSFGTTQTCTLGPQLALSTPVRGVFEALRPHQTGVVSFSHSLTG